VRLHVGAPSKKLSAGGNELSRLILAPDGGPTSRLGLQCHWLVPDELGDAQNIKELVNDFSGVRRAYTDSAAHFEVEASLVRIIGDINVKVVSAFFCTRLRQFAGMIEGRGENVVWRVRLDKWGRLLVYIGDVLDFFRRKPLEGQVDRGKLECICKFGI
jgi:hypothetical protein